MIEIVTAVYENGWLRPLKPLKLREHQTVRLQLLPEKPGNEVEEAMQYLIATGLVTPPSGHSDIEPISTEERYQLAKPLGQAPGKPLSKIIIEERGEE